MDHLATPKLTDFKINCVICARRYPVEHLQLLHVHVYFHPPAEVRFSCVHSDLARGSVSLAWDI